MPEVSYLSDTQFGTIFDDACALLGAKSPVKQKEKDTLVILLRVRICEPPRAVKQENDTRASDIQY